MDSTGDNTKEELSINTAMYHNNQDTAHTNIDTAAPQNDWETPPKAHFSPLSTSFEHRLHNYSTVATIISP